MQIAHDAEVGELEDRGLGILVHDDDRLARLHAGTMLDGAGDPIGDVQLRRDRLAGLPHLVLMRVPPGIRRSSRCSDRSTEAVREFLDDAEALR